MVSTQSAAGVRLQAQSMSQLCRTSGCGLPLCGPHTGQKQTSPGPGNSGGRAPVTPPPPSTLTARTSLSRDKEPDWGLSRSPPVSPPRVTITGQQGQACSSSTQDNPPPTLTQALGPWPRGTAVLWPGCQSGEAVHTTALKMF